MYRVRATDSEAVQNVPNVQPETEWTIFFGLERTIVEPIFIVRPT